MLFLLYRSHLHRAYVRRTRDLRLLLDRLCLLFPLSHEWELPLEGLLVPFVEGSDEGKLVRDFQQNPGTCRQLN